MLRTNDAPSEATKSNGKATHRTSGDADFSALLSQLQEDARRAWQENGRVRDLKLVRLRISAGRALLSLALAGLFWSALLALTLLATLQLLRAVETAVGGSFGAAYGLLASAGVGLGLVAIGVGYAARRGVNRAQASLAGLPPSGSNPAGAAQAAPRAPAPANRSAHDLD